MTKKQAKRIRRKAIKGHTNKYAELSRFKHGPYGDRDDETAARPINIKWPYKG